MINLLVGPIAKIASELIDNIFDTDEEKANAKAKLMLLEQQGKLQEMELSLSAIIAEAKSSDKWTSRARPTFLYLMYSVIVLCFVAGIVGLWWPSHTRAAAENINQLLGAVPEQLWFLFGAGYLGYTGARSFDKWRGTKGHG